MVITTTRPTGPSTVRIPVEVVKSAEDQSDLSGLETVRQQEREIMSLPQDERWQRWNSLSPLLAGFSLNEASFKALEQIYTHDGVRFNGMRGVDDGGLVKKWIECFNNARAVRERRSITVKLLVKNIQAIADLYPEGINVVSVASGSSRCVIEALAQTSGIKVNALMLDWDEEAREYSLQLAEEYGVSERVKVISGDVVRITRYLPETVHIVEAVGIIDYLDDRLTLHLLKQIQRLLAPNGVVIASNIMPNPESEFLHTAIGWRPMYYRIEEEFGNLVTQAGFGQDGCRIYRTPIPIYSLVETKKTTGE